MLKTNFIDPLIKQFLFTYILFLKTFVVFYFKAIKKLWGKINDFLKVIWNV